MYNYRDVMSRRECLLNALLWTVTLGLTLIAFALEWRDIWSWVLVLVQLGACMFHWYRYLAYHKRKN